MLACIFSTRRLIKKLTSLCFEPIITPKRDLFIRNVKFKRRTALAGLLIKDLKIMLRNPNYGAIFFLGPAMAILFILFHIVIGISELFIANLTVSIIMMTTTLVPSTFHVEGGGLGYVLSLPIERRKIVVSKAITLILSYLILIGSIGIYYMIFLKRYTYLILGVFMNIIGVYVGYYKCANKLFNLSIDLEEEIISVQRNWEYVMYMIYVMVVYYALPLIIAVIAEILELYIWFFIIILILLQLIYIGSLKYEIL